MTSAERKSIIMWIICFIMCKKWTPLTYVVQSRKYFVGATKERWQMIWRKIPRILSVQRGKFDTLLHLGLLTIGQTFGHILSAMLRPWWHFNSIEAWKWKKMTHYNFIGSHYASLNQFLKFTFSEKITRILQILFSKPEL
jgi:hypothetical protein